MGKLFVIIGKSSVGKDTIYKKLLRSHLSLKPLITYTTRPPRDNELNGKEYYFCTNSDMLSMQKDDEIIECRKYDTVEGEWFYFTVNNMDLESNNYLTISTLEGYETLRNRIGHDIVIPIYIVASDFSRLSRAINREQQNMYPKYKEVCRRYIADEDDFSTENLSKNQIIHKDWFYNFDNKSRDCILSIMKYINKELSQ